MALPMNDLFVLRRKRDVNRLWVNWVVIAFVVESSGEALLTEDDALHESRCLSPVKGNEVKLPAVVDVVFVSVVICLVGEDTVEETPLDTPKGQSDAQTSTCQCSD